MKVSSTVLLLGATAARYKAMAAPTFYTDRAAFNAASGSGLSFESFEDDFNAASVNFGDFTVTETGSNYGPSNDAVQRANPQGSNDVGGNTDGTYTLRIIEDGTSIGTFSFPDPITKFGIDITFQNTAGLTIGGDVSQSISMTANTPKFWGVIDPDGIDELTFAAEYQYGLSMYFDSLSYGGVVTEQPSSIPSEAPSVSGVPSTEVSNYPTTYIVM